MRKFLFILCLLLCNVLASTAIVGNRLIVTKEAALTVAEREFAGQDVDYYISDGLIYWNVFVDAEPGKGWEMRNPLSLPM